MLPGQPAPRSTRIKAGTHGAETRCRAARRDQSTAVQKHAQSWKPTLVRGVVLCGKHPPDMTPCAEAHPAWWALRSACNAPMRAARRKRLVAAWCAVAAAALYAIFVGTRLADRRLGRG